MANNVIRVGNVEIMQLSDGMLEFDPCNFFPTIPSNEWGPYESHLTDEHKVRFSTRLHLIGQWPDIPSHGLGPRLRTPTSRGRADTRLAAIACGRTMWTGWS